MIIRELKHEELRMAVELNYQCWNDDFAGIIPHDSMNVDKEIKVVSKWINDKNCGDIRRMYGAFQGDNFLGYVGGSVAEKEDADHGVELNYLFVKKEYRGKALGLKLIRTILIEFIEYGTDKLIIYNWHHSESNRFYRYLGGEVIKQVIQTPSKKEALVDVFSWDINKLIKLLNDKLDDRSVDNGGFAFNQSLKDITFKTETGRFVYRAVGVLIHNKKLLIMKDENSPYYYIPGGKVRLHEISSDAIKREIKEEVNIDVNVKRILWICENFFKENASGETFHEIGIYYLLELNDEKILEKGDDFVMTEGGKHELVFSWKPLEQIKDLYLYPLFLKENVLNLPNNIEHVVERKL